MTIAVGIGTKTICANEPKRRNTVVACVSRIRWVKPVSSKARAGTYKTW